MTARGILNKVRPGKQTQTLEGESPCENLHSSFLASLLLAAAVTVRAQEQTNYINYYFFRQVWLLPRGCSHPTLHRRFAVFTLGTDPRKIGRRRQGTAQSRSELRESLFEFLRARHLGSVYVLQCSGPIAITDQAVETNPAAVDERYHLDELYDRVNKLIVCVQPSLENNERLGPTSSVKEYFDQIRDALQQVSKLYSQLAHSNPQVYFIRTKVAQTDRAVALAGNNRPKITPILPNRKLPTSPAWMFPTKAHRRHGSNRRRC